MPALRNVNGAGASEMTESEDPHARADATRWRTPSDAAAPEAPADATRLRPATDAPAATRLRGSTHAPEQRPPAQATRLRRSATGGSTGPTWGDPAQWAHEESRTLEPGDVVKDRFVLEDVIGRGGMGIVFRARDLRKEEAQDRRPHVALKVLNDEFKRHPESLKALQREARKAQNLAHPNIVTVYDFDRDGANVFMVMELLEGEPLDRMIRGLNGRGLAVAAALPIVRALCNALSYAHEHGVVHSDFKPANAYVAKSAIKVLDFGIARAGKHHGALDDSGELTLFDAGTLGALTPAYASCEMIDGLEPDPRDDIYALGCVTYELLTGRHPFDRKDAAQARGAKLRPAPIRGLTRLQWRTLRRALAFERDARLASAAELLDGITPVTRSPARWIGGAAAILAAGIGAALLVPRYLEYRDVEALTAMVRSGAADSIEQALPRIETLPSGTRAGLLLDDAVRTALVAHFDALIQEAIDAGRQRYDYPQADALVARLKGLYPDSQAVAEIGERLIARKNDEIKRESDRFDDLLQKGWLVDAQNSDNITRVLAVIAHIDPKHPLLADPRLPSAYAEQTQLALERRDVPLAESLVAAGLAAAPDDRTLKDLDDRVSREVDAQRRTARLVEARRNVAQRLPETATLDDFAAVHADLAALEALAPDDAQLSSVIPRLEALLGRGIDARLGQGGYDAAHEVLASFADVVRPAYVERERAAIERARAKAGAPPPSGAAVAGLESRLDALLAAPAAEDDWDAGVKAELAKLSAWLAPADAYLDRAKRTAAMAHVEAARTLASQSRLTEAERALELAARYAPTLDAVVGEQQAVAELRAADDARRKEEARRAELAALQQKLVDQATANEVDEALMSLRTLRAGLRADDPFLSSAPKEIAAAYLRLAGLAARDGKLDSAVELVDHALELDGSNPDATTLRTDYARRLEAAQAAAARAAASVTPEKSAPEAAAASAAQKSAAEASAAANARADTASAGIAASAAAPVAGGPAARAASAAASRASRSSACTPSLAGYGSRSRGVCFDALPDGRGPELVVIPAGGGIDRPFAMSRYEISVTEFNTFCSASAGCKPASGEGDLPVTAISLEDAQRYAEWLGAAAGAVYRLPSEAEWAHAASAPTAGTQRDFNCVVEIGGQKIRGFALTSVRSGRPNGWGLFNPIGNAQEWVKTGDGWSARGGAYNDPISQCTAELARATSGAPEATTGFRVVRELR
jgi:non-specific serine/threonine protein kinase